METPYQKLAPKSKVWVYQSNRLLTNEEVAQIREAGRLFIASWTAHGALLEATFEIYHNLFLVVAADEAITKATGCSIDTSVHWIQSIEKQLGVNLFDRMKVAYRGKNGIEIATIDEMEKLFRNGAINPNTIVFNNTITTKKEFEENWEVPLEKSWVSQRLS